MNSRVAKASPIAILVYRALPGVEKSAGVGMVALTIKAAIPHGVAAFFRAYPAGRWHTAAAPWQTLNHSEPASGHFWPITCH